MTDLLTTSISYSTINGGRLKAEGILCLRRLPYTRLDMFKFIFDESKLDSNYVFHKMFLISINNLNDVGSETLTSVTPKTAVFWVVAPCSLVEVYRRFRGPRCLYHQTDGLLIVL
jgi:hypothetical protein